MPNSRLEQLKALLAESPNESFLLFALAKEYEKLGEPALALQHYRQLQEKDTAYIGTYYHLGKLYEQLNEPGKAWQTYQQGMEIARLAGDQHALSELAGARLALGDEDDFEL